MEFGKTYRFRLIHGGTQTHQNVVFEGHKVKIVELDGTEVQPTPVENVDIHAGQRVTVEITMDQSVEYHKISIQMSSVSAPC